MQTWLKSFESKFSEALEAFVCVCVKGTKIADMSGWVQKVHIHHPGEPRWLSQRAVQAVRETEWASRCGGASDVRLMADEW